MDLALYLRISQIIVITCQRALRLITTANNPERASTIVLSMPGDQKESGRISVCYEADWTSLQIDQVVTHTIHSREMRLAAQSQAVDPSRANLHEAS